ncbi:U5 small nuclear ribonucleoprotein TSSC4 [Lampetra fluviatilis]
MAANPPQLDSESSSDSDVEDAPVEIPSKPNVPFMLMGTSLAFSSRTRGIFDSLETAAKTSLPSLSNDNLLDGEFKRPPPAARPPRSGRGKRSWVASNETAGREPRTPLDSFNSLPPPAPGATPDFQVNPSRWTRYSLEDVEDDGTNVSNASVAHAFLSEMHGRNVHARGHGSGSGMTDDGDGVIAFNQPLTGDASKRIKFSKPMREQEPAEHQKGSIEAANAGDGGGTWEPKGHSVGSLGVDEFPGRGITLQHLGDMESHMAEEEDAEDSGKKPKKASGTGSGLAPSAFLTSKKRKIANIRAKEGSDSD